MYLQVSHAFKYCEVAIFQFHVTSHHLHYTNCSIRHFVCVFPNFLHSSVVLSLINAQTKVSIQKMGSRKWYLHSWYSSKPNDTSGSMALLEMGTLSCIHRLLIWSGETVDFSELEIYNSSTTQKKFGLKLPRPMLQWKIIIIMPELIAARQIVDIPLDPLLLYRS